jgi:hypothetical protein
LGTLVFNANLIADRDLARYYDHIALVTRGRLFDGRRWRAIWDLNVGGYDRYLESYVKRRSVPARAGAPGTE